MAALSEAKVIPVHITEKFGFFSKVICTFGEPQTVRITKEEAANKEFLNEETNRIMKIIYDMKED